MSHPVPGPVGRPTPLPGAGAIPGAWRPTPAPGTGASVSPGANNSDPSVGVPATPAGTGDTATSGVEMSVAAPGAGVSAEHSASEQDPIDQVERLLDQTEGLSAADQVAVFDAVHAGLNQALSGTAVGGDSRQERR